MLTDQHTRGKGTLMRDASPYLPPPLCPHPPVENYLKALLSLSRDTGEVSVTDLAGALGVSKPAANSMVKALTTKGLVAYQRYRPLRLTEAGRKAAALIVRKHRLTEMYLVDQMGFAWDEVHAIAEQVEHIDAPRFFRRMDEIMGHPAVDPHGSPIPSIEGEIAATDYTPLSASSAGQHVTLRAVKGDTEELLGYLTRKGIALGTDFEIQEVEPFDGSLRVHYNGREELLTREVARCLLVGDVA